MDIFVNERYRYVPLSGKVDFGKMEKALSKPHAPKLKQIILYVKSVFAGWFWRKPKKQTRRAKRK